MSNLKLGIDICREDNDTVYTIRVFDIDKPINKPVNFQSYECVWFAQGYDFDDMMDRLKSSSFRDVLKYFQLY